MNNFHLIHSFKLIFYKITKFFYLFDFYKRLWEKEKDAFLAAYIQKHRIFAIRTDVEPQEISREEALKMGALMQGMSDESPLRAIEAGK